MTRIFCGAGSIEHGCWWFRIFGYGLLLRAPWDEPLFGERYGHTKPIARLKKWRLFTLDNRKRWIFG